MRCSDNGNCAEKNLSYNYCKSSRGNTMKTMPISELIEKVSIICKKNGVKRLDLFGSFATGTATPTSDIDFVVYGCENLIQLEDDLDAIDTLRKMMKWWEIL